MKTKFLVFGLVSCFLFVSCNKDEQTSSAINAADVAANVKMDNISDDVLQVVESQSNETLSGKANLVNDSFLTSCATVSTLQSGTTWTRTVDFGTTNCMLANGNNVRGKIILTFTSDFLALTRTITYAFENFYHNDRHVEGIRTVVKTVLANGHPQATINLNMTVTNTDGSVFTRIGTRVREFSEGYATPFNLADNVFSITGNWATTLPSGISHTATITSPIIIKWSCPNIVSGAVTFVRNTSSAFLDYGDGTCDNQATITINGVDHAITLGN